MAMEIDAAALRLIVAAGVAAGGPELAHGDTIEARVVRLMGDGAARLQVNGRMLDVTGAGPVQVGEVLQFRVTRGDDTIRLTPVEPRAGRGGEAAAPVTVPAPSGPRVSLAAQTALALTLAQEAAATPGLAPGTAAQGAGAQVSAGQGGVGAGSAGPGPAAMPAAVEQAARMARSPQLAAAVASTPNPATRPRTETAGGPRAPGAGTGMIRPVGAATETITTHLAIHPDLPTAETVPGGLAGTAASRRETPARAPDGALGLIRQDQQSANGAPGGAIADKASGSEAGVGIAVRAGAAGGGPEATQVPTGAMPGVVAAATDAGRKGAEATGTALESGGSGQATGGVGVTRAGGAPPAPTGSGAAMAPSLNGDPAADANVASSAPGRDATPAAGVVASGPVPPRPAGRIEAGDAVRAAHAAPAGTIDNGRQTEPGVADGRRGGTVLSGAGESTTARAGAARPEVMAYAQATGMLTRVPFAATTPPAGNAGLGLLVADASGPAAGADGIGATAVVATNPAARGVADAGLAAVHRTGQGPGSAVPSGTVDSAVTEDGLAAGKPAAGGLAGALPVTDRAAPGSATTGAMPAAGDAAVAPAVAVAPPARVANAGGSALPAPDNPLTGDAPAGAMPTAGRATGVAVAGAVSTPVAGDFPTSPPASLPLVNMTAVTAGGDAVPVGAGQVAPIGVRAAAGTGLLADEAGPGRVTNAQVPGTDAPAPAPGLAPEARARQLEAALSEAVHAAVQGQGGLGALLALVDGVRPQQAAAMPALVRRALADLAGLRLGADDGIEPPVLKAAIARSGVFLEAGLAAGDGTAGAGDVKAALAAAREALRGWLGEAMPRREPEGAMPPPPPRRGEVGKAQVTPPGLFAAATAEEAGERLLERTEAALDRVRLSQYASLDAPADPRAARTEAQHRQWSVELPLLIGRDTHVIPLQIGRERRKRPGREERETLWRLRFALAVEPFGPLLAQVTMLEAPGQPASVGVTVWAERPGAAETLGASARDLRRTLDAAGVMVDDITLLAGAPPRGDGPKSPYERRA